jgi:hypothetical protein
MAHDTVPNAGEIDTSDAAPHIAPLSALDDYEIADGYPEVRGWDVRDADDRSIGYVYDLMVDVPAMRVRFLDVELSPRFAAVEADRRVLIPMENVDLDGTGDVVLLPSVPLATVRDLVPFARRGVPAVRVSPPGDLPASAG